jgi:prophage antirepressor-like protein
MENNNVKVFENTEFGELEILLINGKEYFPATQCAKILGYVKPADAVRMHCKGVFKMQTPTNGGNQTVNYIPEGDLYRLIVKSKLPAAEKFERWVFDEVLPTIRKTGGYVSDDDLFVNTYLPYADDNIKNLFKLQLNTIRQLNSKIKQDEPLVSFATHIQTSKDCISMNDMSKLANKNGINIGRNRLFSFLREKKVLNQQNVPYQKYLDNQPWFQVTERTYYVYGDAHISLTTRVTPKGQIGIIRMLKKDFT